MDNQPYKSRRIYGWLLIPVASAILALVTHEFGFKAVVAGSGIIIILFLFFGRLKRTMDVWLIIGAFIFSIGGDWCLSNRNGDEWMFITGILLFFIAHAGYLYFGLLNGQINWRLTIILLAAYLSFFIFKLYPAFDNRILCLASLAYLLISCVSLGASAGIIGFQWFRWFYFTGISLVLFSDTVIAFKELLAIHAVDFLILPTYYLAQICITIALIRKGLENDSEIVNSICKSIIAFNE